jgi:hypothetical protein
MIDRAAVEAWVSGYVRAWRSNAPADIEALFTRDAIYRPTPASDGWRGRPAIVDGWLARRDEPGAWTFDWTILAIDDGVAFVRGVTRYAEPRREYDNLWELHFAGDGRVREYIEWWVDRATPDPGEPPSA